MCFSVKFRVQHWHNSQIHTHSLFQQEHKSKGVTLHPLTAGKLTYRFMKSRVGTNAGHLVDEISEYDFSDMQTISAVRPPSVELQLDGGAATLV